MKRIGFAMCGLAILFTAALGAQQAAATPTYEQSVFNTWKALHDKILAMAKDTQFPDDKLSSKPHVDSRSVLDEFRHVTIGLEWSAAELKGEKYDYAGRLKADEAKPKTRASAVAEMEAAIAASYPLVQSKPTPRLIFWIDHQAEHYGKLVSNYRMNNIVPPVSRRSGARVLGFSGSRVRD